MIILSAAKIIGFQTNYGFVRFGSLDAQSLTSLCWISSMCFLYLKSFLGAEQDLHFCFRLGKVNRKIFCSGMINAIELAAFVESRHLCLSHFQDFIR